MSIKGLTEGQVNNEKVYGIQYKLDDDNKMYYETTKEYENFLILEEFDRKCDLITNGYNQVEIDSFPTQLEEAKKVKKGEVSEFIDDLVYDGFTSLDIANNILEKSKEYKKLFAKALKEKKQRQYNLENNL